MGKKDRRNERVKISKLSKEQLLEKIETLRQTEPELSSVYARHLVQRLEIVG
jgi:hypothetical protein